MSSKVMMKACGVENNLPTHLHMKNGVPGIFSLLTRRDCTIESLVLAESRGKPVINMLFQPRFLVAISLATKAIDDGELQHVDDDGRALKPGELAEPTEEFT